MQIQPDTNTTLWHINTVGTVAAVRQKSIQKALTFVGLVVCTASRENRASGN